MGESYLLNPEEGDHFCPQCGIRVAPRQEICHKCNAETGLRGPAVPQPGAVPPASGEAGAPPKPPPHLEERPSRPPGLPLWVPASFIAAGFIIVILLAVIFTRPGPKAPGSETQAPAGPVTTSPPAATTTSPPTSATPTSPQVVTPPPQATTPAEPPATPAAKPEEATVSEGSTSRSREETMMAEVRETLKNLRKAQLTQDIILFMSCYSYLYPSLDKKRRDTLSFWKNFRYMDLEFSLDEIKPLGPDSLLAHVTWNMQVQNLRTHEFQSSTQIFEVAMGKELGLWRIRSLKDVTDYEE